MGEAKSLKSKWLIKFMKLYVPLSVHRARNILHMKKTGADNLNHLKIVHRDVFPTK